MWVVQKGDRYLRLFPAIIFFWLIFFTSRWHGYPFWLHYQVIWIKLCCARGIADGGRDKFYIRFKRPDPMEPQKFYFGLGFIFLAGIRRFISFKLQSTMASTRKKNITNLLAFSFLAVAAVVIFRMYSQEYISTLSHQGVDPTSIISLMPLA